MPNEDGGIVDDLIIYKTKEDEFLLVVNASNIEKDWNWIKKHSAIYRIKALNLNLFILFWRNWRRVRKSN
jgi:glycine cleavage system aminomethyltransferase T